tara:strand:+ start:240 stop:644 length:405 start_codon:yes stop_codon:yes gene_type:complete
MIRHNGTPMPSDSWLTPQWILDLVGECFDPCPFKPDFNADTDLDGLRIEWPSRTFVNPPYSNVKVWVLKALREHEQGKTVIMLLKHDSSTKWYQMLHEAGAFILPIQGRLHFRNSLDSSCKMRASFPSILVVLS